LPHRSGNAEPLLPPGLPVDDRLRSNVTRTLLGRPVAHLEAA
jgi:hypothetical protein